MIAIIDITERNIVVYMLLISFPLFIKIKKKINNNNLDEEEEYICSICYINDIGGPEVNKKNALNNKLFPKDDEISESFKKIKKERNFSKLSILDEKYFNSNILNNKI